MGEPFLGEIKYVSFNLAPKGWAFCNGQTMPINSNQALFSLLSTYYGGDGVTTFKLPNLQGRVPLHVSSNYPLGANGGEAQHALTILEMPSHQHAINVDGATAATSNSNVPTGGKAIGASIGHPSSGSDFTLNIYNSTLASATQAASQMIASNGGGQPHENRQPFQVINAIISLQGYYPSRN